MALKDWKKVRTNVWKYIRGINKDNVRTIKVIDSKDKLLKKPYWVYVVGVPAYNSGIIKSTKTKLQALKFARAYMRKH